MGVAAEDFVADVDGDIVTVGDADDEVETVALANDDGDVEGDPEEDLVAEFVGVACEEGDVDDDGDIIG